MKNLRPPIIDVDEAYRDVVDAKTGSRGVRLRKLLPQVRLRQRRYKTSTAKLASLPIWTALTSRQKADLLHCYVVSTKPLAKLCKAVTAAQDENVQAQCQYCGVNPLTRTFDHYLPKETFAEYAAFAPNLLPCCTDCNNKKGRIWLVHGRRVILNLYYDQLPHTQFLSAKIKFSGNKPKAFFSLSSNNALYGGKRQLIRSHFKRLDLLNVYSIAATTHISEILDCIRELRYGQSKAQIAAALRRAASRQSREFSPNYWKVALLRAIADSPRCMAM